MDLSNILAISGKPGLFKMIGQMKNGLVVESLLDGKRFPAYSTEKVSALEDISIYGHSDDIPLKDIFDLLYEKEGGEQAAIAKASVPEMRDYFAEMVTDYDPDRVYASDIKKVFRWYNILIEAGLLTAAEAETDEAEVDEAPEAAAETATDEAEKAAPDAGEAAEEQAPSEEEAPE